VPKGWLTLFLSDPNHAERHAHAPS
jgi:hypothetical protein